jgi:hypothetical protein
MEKKVFLLSAIWGGVLCALCGTSYKKFRLEQGFVDQSC